MSTHGAPGAAARWTFSTRGAVCDRDGTAWRLALAREWGSVEVYESGRLIRFRQLFGAGQEAAERLAFSVDGQRLGVWGSAGTLALWTIDGDDLLTHTLPRSGGEACLFFDEEGELVLLTSGLLRREQLQASGIVQIWTEEPESTLVVALSAKGLRQETVDERFVPVTGIDGLVTSAAPAVPQRLEHWAFPGSGLVRRVVEPRPGDGRVVALGPSEGHAVAKDHEGCQLINRHTGQAQRLAALWAGSSVLGFVDEERFAVLDQSLLLYDVSGKVLDSSPMADSRVLAVSRSGAVIRRGFEREVLRDWQGQERALSSVAPNCIALPCGDLTVSFTPGESGVFVHDGRQATSLVHSQRPVSSLSVSGDGRVVVAVFLDGVVRRWSVDGALLGESPLFSAETELLPSLTLDSSGRRGVEENKVLRLFDLERFTEAGRFPFQKKRADVPTETQAEDARMQRKLDAAWDAFMELHAFWNPGLVLSDDGGSLAFMEGDEVLVYTLGRSRRRRIPAPAGSTSRLIASSEVLFAMPGGLFVKALASAARRQLALGNAAGRLVAASGRWVALSAGTDVEIWDLETGALRWRAASPVLHHPLPWVVSLSADGTRLSFSRGARVVRLTEPGVRSEFAALGSGAFLQVTGDHWHASPAAFAVGFLTLGGLVADSREVAAELLGER